MKLKILFVDDDPFLLESIQRSLIFSCPDWEAQFAESGSDAIKIMRSESFDAVVSDMRMPGMLGTELLEHVRDYHPETIRVILSGQAEKESVIRSHQSAQQYLSKPCQVKELSEVLERAFLLRDHLKNPKLRSVVSKIERWPVLKPQREKLERLLNCPSVTCEEIGVEVAKDLAITSNMLRLANSPLLGINRTVADVTEAILFLGVDSIRSMLLFSGIFADYEQRKIDSNFLRTLADHSFAVGTRALGIAKRAKLNKTEQSHCLLAGLMHDLGKLVMIDHFTDTYFDVIETANSTEKPIHEVEAEVFDATHADISACLLGIWGFPDLVVEAVAFHHNPNPISVQRLSPVSILYLANLLVSHTDQKRVLPTIAASMQKRFSIL